MTDPLPRPLPSLVSCAWLAARLDHPGLAVLDASRHLPAAGRDAAAEFADGHIPGARFLDLAALSDETSPVPQALPRPDQLAAHLAALGIAPGTAIVLYDDSAVRTAARAWFMLRESGWADVAILDGGLGKWRAEGLPVDSGAPAAPASASPASLAAPGQVRSKADLLANLASHAEQVIDARGADRVFGTGIDPVHGLPMGRIPGALNVPYTGLFEADGTYKAPAALREAFAEGGVDLASPVTTTCGSGITACTLLFALHLIGKDDTALYDGSWLEWGADPATPKQQGPAA